MEIIRNLGKLKDGRTALVLKDAYDPNFAIVRGFDGNGWGSATYFDGNLVTFAKEVLAIEGISEQETAAGTLTTQMYDDGCAKGVQAKLDGEIVCMVDVPEDGEIRVLPYYEGSDEPMEAISLNR